MKLPLARSRDVVVQSLGGETLIYDLAIDKAFCLNETAAKVFEACDGETTLAELKRKHRFGDDLIFLALAQLQEDNLIENSTPAPFEGLSRREAIRRVGLGSIIALPVVSSLVAPTAARAASVSCVNPGGSPAGTSVFATGNGGNDSTASAACLTTLNNRCCSGNANGSIGFCAGASGARSCSCNGTCT